MIDKKTFERYANDPMAFVHDVTIEANGEPRRFGDVVEPWQIRDYEALSKGLLRCHGRTDEDATLKAFLERPRGHDKSSMLALLSSWLLAFAPRPMQGYWYAADKDQAQLGRLSCVSLTRLNPWLGQILTVGKDAVTNVAEGHPGESSILKFESSDEKSSYGIRPSFIIADEFCHWGGDGGLWHSLISSAAKNPSRCLVAIITNSGVLDTYQWDIREAIRQDPSWHFSRLDGPQASWITGAALDQQRKILPAPVFERLWDNRWTYAENPALNPKDLEAAFSDDNLKPTGQESGWVHVGGLDLSTKRDHSAFVVLQVGENTTENAGKVRLASKKVWKPRLGRKIDLTEIERTIREAHEQYRFVNIGYDPWQAEMMAQRLRYDEIPMQEITPTPANLQDMASRLLELFQDGRFTSHRDDELMNDLRRLSIAERTFGFRLVSPRDSSTGHGDLASGFTNAVLVASEQAGADPVPVFTTWF